MTFHPAEHREFCKWFLADEDVLGNEPVAQETESVAQGNQPGNHSVAGQGAAGGQPGQGAAGGQPGQGATEGQSGQGAAGGQPGHRAD